MNSHYAIDVYMYVEYCITTVGSRWKNNREIHKYIYFVYKCKYLLSNRRLSNMVYLLN